MIQIKNLSFGYKKSPVLSNIDLSFEKGHIYGLLGENGVGKTTLLKLISGLQKPQQGLCMVDDFVSFDRKPEFLQNIFFMPDEAVLPYNSTPNKYVHELESFYPGYLESTFVSLMKEMQVDPDKSFKTMSYGQQKKSLIACALSLGTDYVLLDEPTNGLDIPSKADFRRLLTQMTDERKTIIISTHQVKDVENLIDPIIILCQNEVLLNASMERITEKLFFEYGGMPRADALYSEMQPAGCMNVVANTEGEESQVNIEALFNAVLRNRETIKSLFGC